MLDEAAALVESVDEPPPSIEALVVEDTRAAHLEPPLDELASLCAGGWTRHASPERAPIDTAPGIRNTVVGGLEILPVGH